MKGLIYCTLFFLVFEVFWFNLILCQFKGRAMTCLLEERTVKCVTSLSPLSLTLSPLSHSVSSLSLSCSSLFHLSLSLSPLSLSLYLSLSLSPPSLSLAVFFTSLSSLKACRCNIVTAVRIIKMLQDLKKKEKRT